MTGRSQILAALQAALQQITTANGYATDLYSRVFIDRDLERQPLAITEIPCIVVGDGPADTTVELYPGHSHRLSVELLSFTTGSGSTDQARELVQDALTALGVDDTLGGLCIEIIPTGHDIGKAAFGDFISAGRNSITVHYRTALWKI